MELLKSVGERTDIIEACKQRKEWALKWVYEEHFSMMMSICMRFSGREDDALDLLHEGFIKVINNFEKFQDNTSLPAWLHRVMVNSCIDQYRKQSRRKTEDLEQVYNIQSLDPDAISRFTEKEIMAAIQKLSPVYRTIFVLFVIEGFSHKEIAVQLNINESTSRSNLVKARLKLQELLISHKK